MRKHKTGKPKRPGVWKERCVRIKDKYAIILLHEWYYVNLCVLDEAKIMT